MGCSGGGGFAPCPGGFAGGCYFCFSVNTKMIVSENGKECTKSVSEIRKGDLVLTFDGKEKIFTKIIESKKNEGIFEFYEIIL